MSRLLRKPAINAFSNSYMNMETYCSFVTLHYKAPYDGEGAVESGMVVIHSVLQQSSGDLEVPKTNVLAGKLYKTLYLLHYQHEYAIFYKKDCALCS